MNNLPTTKMTVLKNGLKVITQRSASMQSGTLLVQVNSGMRNEPANLKGISHFVEHMMFNGTTTRTVKQLKQELNALGTKINAATGGEVVCYYSNSLSSVIPDVLEIMADMLVNSNMPEERVEKERTVICNEAESKGETMQELFHKGFWQYHPLGSMCNNDKKLICSFTRKQLMEYKKANYLANNMAIVATGNVRHKQIVALCKRLFKDLPTGKIKANLADKNWKPGLGNVAHSQVKSEQTSFYMCYPAPLMTDTDYYAFMLLEQILGTGSGSKLFYQLRECHNLVYCIETDKLIYRDTGTFIIKSKTKPDSVSNAVNICHKELMRFCTEPLSGNELKAGKKQLTTQALLSLDDSEIQGWRISIDENHYGKPIDISEVLKRINAVTAKDIQKMAQKYFSGVIPFVQTKGPGETPVFNFTV